MRFKLDLTLSNQNSPWWLSLPHEIGQPLAGHFPIEERCGKMWCSRHVQNGSKPKAHSAASIHLQECRIVCTTCWHRASKMIQYHDSIISNAQEKSFEELLPPNPGIQIEIKDSPVPLGSAERFDNIP